MVHTGPRPTVAMAPCPRKAKPATSKHSSVGWERFRKSCRCPEGCSSKPCPKNTHCNKNHACACLRLVWSQCNGAARKLGVVIGAGGSARQPYANCSRDGYSLDFRNGSPMSCPRPKTEPSTTKPTSTTINKTEAVAPCPLACYCGPPLEDSPPSPSQNRGKRWLIM